ncbi:MAG: hypothetical protein PHI06_02795 [Desulfobulbaceae bacterium]|nr:hypothetical protein [Desulfobulbaceae bacterium]
MSVNYTVQANVIDIRHDTPKPEDVFLVDTNVWYWMTYTKASQTARPYQIRDYPSYIGRALSTRSQLCKCGLSLEELSHRIEKTEYDIFARTQSTIRPKEYRHNFPAERLSVVTEIQAAWGQVKSMAKAVDVTIDMDSTDRALTRMASDPLDGYDLFILEALSQAGIVNVITDDGDYAIIPGIQLFTANNNVIESARKQGRLIGR